MLEMLKRMFGGAGGDDANQAIAEGALVIDVRTPEEFAFGHYPNALHVPVDEVARRVGEIEEKAGTKARPIVVYCASGMRSGRAKMLLERSGFTAVRNGGGLHALR